MDTKNTEIPATQKREQKFLRFKLEADDTNFLDQLSCEQRAILLTSGSYQERAANLNIPVGTVRSRLHRARAALEALRHGKAGMDIQNAQLN